MKVFNQYLRGRKVLDLYYVSDFVILLLICKYSVMRTLPTPYKLRTFAAKFNHLKFCDNVQQETDPETSVRGGEAY